MAESKRNKEIRLKKEAAKKLKIEAEKQKFIKKTVLKDTDYDAHITLVVSLIPHSELVGLEESKVLCYKARRPLSRKAFIASSDALRVEKKQIKIPLVLSPASVTLISTEGDTLVYESNQRATEANIKIATQMLKSEAKKSGIKIVLQPYTALELKNAE